MASLTAPSARITGQLAAHPRIAAALLGALAACGFAPLGAWPLTLLGLAGLLVLIAGAGSLRGAAGAGWWFGLGHFIVGNNWIATAFTYQAEMPAWLGWVAVAGLACYLALYPMLAALAARALARDDRLALIPALAGSWAIAEWLRGWVFTGYAWNPLAMVTLGPDTRPGLAALAAWTGTYALSGVVVLLAGCWAVALSRQARDWKGVVLLALPVAAMLIPRAAEPPARLTALPYTLVQPDVRQDVLNDPRNFEAQFQKTALLSLPRRPGERRIVLWPESGVPDYLRDGYPPYLYEQTTFAADPVMARTRIGRVAGPNGLLMTGAVDLELRDGRAIAARNAVTVIDEAGAIRAGYAKAHLVPGGEYLPLRGLLEPLGLSRLVAGSLDFWPGPGPRTLDLGPWGKAGVQICYEIIFSGEVVDPAQRPDYIFNPSNDGWFGSFGPPQHLAQARMRAIEEGLPVLRATTTGISAVIDSDGVVRARIARHRAGRLDGLVPAARAPTPFARLGNMLPLAIATLLLAVSIVAMRRRTG